MNLFYAFNGLHRVVEIGLVLLKRFIQLKLHYLAQITDVNELVQMRVVEHDTFLRYIQKLEMIILPHLPRQPESQADIGARIFDGMQKPF